MAFHSENLVPSYEYTENDITTHCVQPLIYTYLSLGVMQMHLCVLV